MLRKAIELFSRKDISKHLIVLTDALPTVGDDPHKDTLEAVSIVKSEGITISIAGIDLDDKGAEFAESLVQLGEGKLYRVKNLEELDEIILEDYYSFC